MGDIIDLYEMVKDLEERIETLENKIIGEQEDNNNSEINEELDLIS